MDNIILILAFLGARNVTNRQTRLTSILNALLIKQQANQHMHPLMHVLSIYY